LRSTWDGRPDRQIKRRLVLSCLTALDFIVLGVMTPRIQLFVRILFLLLCATQSQRAASPPPNPDKDPQLLDLFKEAKILIEAKKPQSALEKYEKVIASFEAHYANNQSKIYCARGTTESATYLVMAAAAMTKGEFDKDKKNAITLSSTWADAYFMKAYALQDLGRIAEAKSAVQLALQLSPLSSRYLSEFGSIYVLEKNWAKAQEVFEKAEDNASLAPDDSKAEDLGKARRGLGYVFVELGQLDEAEKKYQQCLATDPKDTKAAQELEYVRGLRAKAKPR
jgi:tetratricopeptide (TPR) repeat protein